MQTPRTNSKRRLRTVDLFSGIGGISLGLKDWCCTVAYCDISDHCKSTLKHNIQLGRLDEAPIFSDVCKFPSHRFKNVDIITMGFPCKDISGCGHQRGLVHTPLDRKRKAHGPSKEGRSGLFFSGLRIIQELKPRYVFLENVSNITSMEQVWKTVLRSLHSIGYTETRFGILGACDVGAPHNRRRWFCVAKHSNATWSNPCFNKTDVANTPHYSKVWNSRGRTTRKSVPWEIDIPRMCSRRTFAGKEKLRQLGNMCVPQCAKKAFHTLFQLDSTNTQTPSIKQSECFEKCTKLPNWGCSMPDLTIRTLPSPIPKCSANLNICLLPSRGVPRSHSRRTRPLLSEPKFKKLWATPRAGGINQEGSPGVGSLTGRTQHDLSTQLFHEKNTRVQGRQENPDWVEWLMGLPPGWTVCATSTMPQ